MRKSIPVHKKKDGRGRPATGHDPAVTIRIPETVLAAAVDWGSAQAIKSRSEAIVRLVERGLTAVQVDAQVAANRAATPKRGRK
jgi:hypothetical protein